MPKSFTKKLQFCCCYKRVVTFHKLNTFDSIVQADGLVRWLQVQMGTEKVDYKCYTSKNRKLRREYKKVKHILKKNRNL